jgi:hypothetical protein
MIRPILVLGQAERSRSIGRRASLRLMTACLLAGAASPISVGRETDKKKSVCADPAALGAANRRQRELDNYTEKSPDPSKTCSGCRYFTAAVEATACGKCEIFNGPANPKGRCDDWTPRPA